MRKFLLFVCILGLTVASASSVVATTITGTVTSQGSMISTSAWDTESTLQFWVSDPAQNNDLIYGDYWYYRYTFTPIIAPITEAGGISHVGIEVSSAFTSANVFGPSGSYDSGVDNPGVEGVDAVFLSTIGGSMDNLLKFSGTGASDPFTFSFYSNIGPMYGDFLAKDGIDTWAYNSAIGVTPRPEFDWGSYVDRTGDGWIVGPDTAAVPEPVPEPATILLLGSGLVGLAGIARRKFRKN